MTASRPMPALRHDERGFIRGLIFRTIIGLALLGIALFDVTQCLIAQIHAESTARAAALAGSDTYFRTKRKDLAEVDALAAARSENNAAKVIYFGISPDGTVTVEVETSAETLVVKRVGFLKHFGTQHATDGEARGP